MASIASETQQQETIPATIAKEKNRGGKNAQYRPGFAFTPQIVFKASGVAKTHRLRQKARE